MLASDSINEVAKAARDYLNAGFNPVVLWPHLKKPVGDEWPDKRYTVEEISREFSSTSNVGVIVGRKGNNRQDVDIEVPEGVGLAPWFLPNTSLVHGRPSLPSSHPWYVVTGDAPEFLQLKDVDGYKIVELRWGDGHQQMVPPSVHPDTGEQLIWYENGTPATVSGTELSRSVKELAAATLVVRHYPTIGTRHEFALAFAGFLLRRGWPVEKVRRFVEAVATVAGDGEIADRLNAVETTSERLASGDETVGGGKLRELLGNGVFSRFCEWLGFSVHARFEPVEADAIPDESAPFWPPDILEGDYIADLTWQLTKGTSVPPQYVREEIVLVLGALADGKLGYPRHPDLPQRRYLAVLSEYPQAGKGEATKRVLGNGSPMRLLFGDDLRILNGTGIGSGQYLAKELQANPCAICVWDELSHLLQVSNRDGSTLCSALKSLYESNSHWTGSLTNKKYGGDDLHLSVLMQATRSTFQQGFALRQAVGDGLLSRFVLVYCAGMPACPEWELRDMTEEKKIVETIRQLIPVTYLEPTIADDARERVHAFAREINNPLNPEFMATRRLLELVKVDLLHRCVYSGSDKITLEMAERSIAWGHHQLALRRHLWTTDARNEVSAMTQTLLNRLRKGKASPNDLRRSANVYRDGTHELFNRCLNALTRSGQVKQLGKNRRDQPVYALEPDDCEAQGKI